MPLPQNTAATDIVEYPDKLTESELVDCVRAGTENERSLAMEVRILRDFLQTLRDIPATNDNKFITAINTQLANAGRFLKDDLVRTPKQSAEIPASGGTISWHSLTSALGSKPFVQPSNPLMKYMDEPVRSPAKPIFPLTSAIIESQIKGVEVKSAWFDELQPDENTLKLEKEAQRKILALIDKTINSSGVY